MKTKKDNQSGLEELNYKSMIQIDGGGFAYDLGFFIREVAIYVAYGGGMRGTMEVTMDYSLNYASVSK